MKGKRKGKEALGVWVCTEEGMIRGVEGNGGLDGNEGWGKLALLGVGRDCMGVWGEGLEVVMWRLEGLWEVGIYMGSEGWIGV